MALTPLLFFILTYFSLSVFAGDFYQVPISVVFLLSSLFTIAVTGKGSMAKRVETFCQGASTPNVMLMILIFLLAGAFASVAKEIGAIEATVNLTMHLLPGNWLMAGMFIAACFVSLSIGTSVGTIAALVPIATGIAEQTQGDVAAIAAVVVGGAFFGDNLSIISDTTVMATRTQHCQMNDKFKANIRIILPGALLVLLFYILNGHALTVPEATGEVSVLKVAPYIIVLASALAGMNVITVLTIGLLLCSGIGLADGAFDIIGAMKVMSNGFFGMSELIIVSLLAAGMLGMIKEAGGIDLIIKKLTQHISSKKGAEFVIAALVCVVNVCTANNTIAILTVGNIAHNISKRYKIDNRRTASLLDTFSCFTQGFLPYGAQLLIAAGLAETNPINIIPHLYYPMAIGVCAVMAIVFQYPRKYSQSQA